MLIIKFHGFAKFQFENTQNTQFNNIIIIRKPMNFINKVMFERLKCWGYYVIGINSYVTFPIPLEKYSKDIEYVEDDLMIKYDFLSKDSNVENLIGWLWCLRNNEYLKQKIPSIPTLFFAESDIINIQSNNYKTKNKKYDFIYVCSNGKYQEFWKNWKQAKEWIKVMTNLGLKVIIIGKTSANNIFENNITIKPFLPREEFLKVMSESKSLFVPNHYDASPRVITEAMSLNLSILMNENIIGGWHYSSAPNIVTFDIVTTLEQKKLQIKNFVKFHENIDFSKFNNKQWFENYREKKIVELQGFLENLEKPLYKKNTNVIELIISYFLQRSNVINEKFIQKELKHIKNIYFFKIPKTFQTLFSPILIMSDMFEIYNMDYFNHHMYLIKNYYDIFEPNINYCILLSGNKIKYTENPNFLYLYDVEKVTHVGGYVVNKICEKYDVCHIFKTEIATLGNDIELDNSQIIKHF